MPPSSPRRPRSESMSTSRRSSRGQTALANIDKSKLIRRVEELYRSFNPTIDSIDTHVDKNIGSTTDAAFSSLDQQKQAENLFIQQTLYGLMKEKRFIDAFINNFYADNAANISRADSTMYQIFAYLAIFRLEQLKFSRFKEFLQTQDPTKMFYFVDYLFTPDHLKSILLQDWMQIKDLTYVEEQVIAPLLKYSKDALAFCAVLNASAADAKAAQDEKEAAKANGTAGLGEVTKRQLTIPVSPRITATRPPKLPAIEEISQRVVAKDPPG